MFRLIINTNNNTNKQYCNIDNTSNYNKNF